MSNEFDVIFHWGELHSWLGSDWKKHFSKDTEEITMPKGASMSQEAYRAAIFGEYGERPIHTALTRRGMHDLVFESASWGSRRHVSGRPYC